jgi:hypothetical protein
VTIGCAVATGCGGTMVDLGIPHPAPYQFKTPRELSELDTTYANSNPTLTADLLEIFFSTNRSDMQGDVWTARRASPKDPFDPPALVAEVSSPSYETSPAVSLDGLSIYVGSDRDGGLGDIDIWGATRPDRTTAWSAVTDLAAMNSTVKDVPRPPGQHGLVMPMSSERDSVGSYRTFLAARPSVDQPFATPTVMVGLTGASTTLDDAFLTDDGLTLFYASAPVGGTTRDLFVAWRASTADPFSLPTPLRDLNSPADERDPWLSPDGTTFFFSSDRDNGVLQIFEAAASRQTR